MENNKIDLNALTALGIPNLRAITENGIVIGVRGETLSGRNRKYLWSVKKAGIDTVIDLRTPDHTGKFAPACEAAGFGYYNFPVDPAYTSDEEVIRNLPKLIKTIEQGGFYLACALGLHRTDIALALCWLFNPYAQEIPILYGHHRNGIFKCEDIYRRANSVYGNLTDEVKNSLGWDETFDRDFGKRKKILAAAQEKRDRSDFNLWI